MKQLTFSQFKKMTKDEVKANLPIQLIEKQYDGEGNEIAPNVFAEVLPPNNVKAGASEILSTREVVDSMRPKLAEW